MTGRCGCGAVRFHVQASMRDVIDCHCHRCRRFTGHHMAATAAPTDTVAIDGAGDITWWEASPGVEYGFCRHCGSSLFWRTSELANHLSICAGVLDQPTGLTTTKALWMAEFGDYHQPPTGVATFDYDE